MPTKGGRKIPQGPLLVPYEEARLRNCMQNSARLEQLGIRGVAEYIARACGVSKEKNKTNKRSREDSESDYDPLQDATTEEDLVHDDVAEGSKGKKTKKTNEENSDAPVGVKFRSRKRVYADMLLTGVRRSKRNTSQPNASLTPSVNNTSQPNASLTPSVNNVSTPSHPDASQAIEPTDGANAMTDHQADGHIIDAIPQDDGHNNLGNEDCFDEHLDNVIAGSANAITQPAVHNNMTNEDEPGVEEEWNRGVNMGHGLERINRSRRGKLPVVIPQGHIRPLVPIIAAKYATECNIAVRSHVPVLTHWKKYKAKENRAVIARYLGTLQAKFDIDTKDPVVRKGCLEMMKTAVRNWRYKLKQDYFDPFPLHLVTNTSPIPSTNDLQWAELKEMWKNPKKMEVCQKNKVNRGKVKFPQKTGSCSYPVFVENLEDKEEDGEKEKEPVALKLFKACHYSKKTKGFTPTVQSVITEIENRLAAEPAEGEEPKSDVQVVSEVLDQKTKKNLFLQNVGMETARRPRLSARDAAAQLEAEKVENGELRSIISNQSKQMDEMSKKQADLEAKLELLLGRNRLT